MESSQRGEGEQARAGEAILPLSRVSPPLSAVPSAAVGLSGLAIGALLLPVALPGLP